MYYCTISIIADQNGFISVVVGVTSGIGLFKLLKTTSPSYPVVDIP